MQSTSDHAGKENLGAIRSFCHQCRHTTLSSKMTCTSYTPAGKVCGKKFCDRCVSRRYPSLQFDLEHPSFVCPVCTGTCNCTQCSSKNGKAYIPYRTPISAHNQHESDSMKSSSSANRILPASPRRRSSKQKSVARKSVSSSEGRQTSRAAKSLAVATRQSSLQMTRTSFPQAPLNLSKIYWATVYGMKGERIGTAYVENETDDKVFVFQSGGQSGNSSSYEQQDQVSSSDADHGSSILKNQESANHATLIEESQQSGVKEEEIDAHKITAGSPPTGSTSPSIYRGSLTPLSTSPSMSRGILTPLSPLTSDEES